MRDVGRGEMARLPREKRGSDFKVPIHLRTKYEKQNRNDESLRERKIGR